MNSMDQSREFLKTLGLPGGDAYDLPTSEKRFKDGGQYRFEVPGIQGPKVMKALLEAMDSYGIYLHRVTQTQGIMRLTDEEISKMVELADQWKTDLILAIGPRATTDTSASVHTEEGKRFGQSVALLLDCVDFVSVSTAAKPVVALLSFIRQRSHRVIRLRDKPLNVFGSFKLLLYQKLHLFCYGVQLPTGFPHLWGQGLIPASFGQDPQSVTVVKVEAT